MTFTVPTSWYMLTQQQLRHVVRLLWLYQDDPDWEYRVQCAALLHFCSVEVVKPTDQGWLCRQHKTGDEFLLDPELLPSMLEAVAWTVHPEKMRVRIEAIGQYTAVDFELRTLMFGAYLACENYFQAFLQTKSTEHLAAMARFLYQIPEESPLPAFKEEELMGVFLWFNAVKQLLGESFPHFLKPSSSTGTSTGMENQMESVRAQIRLLTKGDVTKREYILDKTDTWAALEELDALAMEAEEIKKKYGK